MTKVLNLRQAGVLIVTPSMLRAGVRALGAWGDVPEPHQEDVAVEVYAAMVAAHLSSIGTDTLRARIVRARSDRLEQFANRDRVVFPAIFSGEQVALTGNRGSA